MTVSQRITVEYRLIEKHASACYAYAFRRGVCRRALCSVHVMWLENSHKVTVRIRCLTATAHSFCSVFVVCVRVLSVVPRKLVFLLPWTAVFQKNEITRKYGNCECIATWGRPTPRRSLSALITTTMPSLNFEVAQPIRCRLIAFLLLIRCVTLWPWPLTFDLERV